ncbi:MAG: FAD-dependent oxidoreductase [Balneolaceae bacterium]
MFTQSLWKTFANEIRYPSLDQDISVDTVIIGGGITGLSVARELSMDNYSIAVLEARQIGGGTTSHSTGNLYSTIDKNLDTLLGKYNSTYVTEVIKARAASVNRIEQNAERYGIDCDFKRQPWYLYSAREDNNHIIEKELNAGERINMPLSTATAGEIPFPITKAVKLEGQAQINPMLYVQGLAESIISEDLKIYENSPVTEVEEHDGYYTAHTNRGKVKAEHVVHATHTPKGIKFVQTLLGPYREYGIACKLVENSHPEGIFWGYFEGRDKISTRTYSRNGETFLIVVGKPHKVGQAESNLRHIRQLEEFAREHFNVQEMVYRWGGQHYRPADSLPYIGREKKGSGVFISTGYSTDGLTYGTMAGMIISDLIAGKTNPWADLFDATRNQPVKAAAEFLKENLNVARQYYKNIPGTLEDDHFAGIAPGDGKVIEKDGHKIAACKDEEGKLYLHSAVCPHMACIVNWNNAESTWDCPCHASRFKPDGSVLEGPAMHPLHEMKNEKKSPG